MKPNLLQAGRFIIQSAGFRVTGLAAHEALEFLQNDLSKKAEIFLINRVTEEGRLELRGIQPDRIREEDCVIVRFDDVRVARKQYETIRDFGIETPPPCTIKLELARVSEWDSAPVIAATFAAPCVNAVAAWFQNATKDSGATLPLQSGRESLEAYHSDLTQVLESKELKTWESQAG